MTYVCQHCGRVLTVTEQYVEVCQCPATTLDEQAVRERSKQLARQKQLTFDEARQKNKCPIRPRKDTGNGKVRNGCR